MIVLFTDFGTEDPYVGQMHAVLAAHAPSTTVIDLLHHVPNFNIQAGAYLLPALVRDLPQQSVIVGIVDPGVGGDRAPIMLRADERWYVGPDNGLFAMITRRASNWECFRIDWKPEYLSDSFHGRDLFAPVAGMLANDNMPQNSPHESLDVSDWPDDLARIIYVDHYGNAMTGVRGESVQPNQQIKASGKSLSYARTFSEVDAENVFWHVNAHGLVEFSVNRGNASDILEVKVGHSVHFG